MFKSIAATAVVALALVAGSAQAQMGLPSLICPPGAAPQAQSYQGCVQVGPVQVCGSYTQQSCQPVPPPAPKPTPAPAPNPGR